MSDSTKPPSIPSWQRQASTAPANESSQSPSSSPISDDAPTPTSRSELVEQAARFLEDEAIRSSPTDRKISFLESKGLNKEEIDQLLGVSRNEQAPPRQRHPPKQLPCHKPDPLPPPPPHPAMCPPIITYPEFLLQSAKPPPLVTMQRVLYTLYGAAGLGASIYGASEYLVKPMLAQLTDARHDLFSTANANLKKLNEKLESSVSEVPPHLHAHKISLPENEDEDTDSVTSDPTELFHRDIGTQTTPTVLSEALDPAAKEGPESETTADAPMRAVTGHMSRLESIQAQLKEINDVERESSSLEDSVRARMTDLHHYLDGLIYSAPTYTAAGSGYGLYSTTANGSGSSAGVPKSEEDAIAGFKAEIRGVKGALLSARNFPASRGGRFGGAAAAR
ncbi:hypothetical protein N7468_007249 [Penicillium chermesinum]|uniref:Peroxisomal membrane protein PEX14 n=1 Tax=Penicillium chermesinum TaxID=63820 RepID=A0A9W9TKL4_9EURO|nr:uncharacterized protein N7468_007249 [Penicillium chermesinum]KAJ5226024.1 hypothetical protein N7468_007249 [Penicillium chermesinum]KAJ6160780.1 hypothetical protein N7470_004176 [Penicillium chermesinum]